MSLIAETAVSGTAYSFDMLFSYAVPEHMQLRAAGAGYLCLSAGAIRRRIGVVMRLSEGSTAGLKPLAAQLMMSPSFRRNCCSLRRFSASRPSAPILTR